MPATERRTSQWQRNATVTIAEQRQGAFQEEIRQREAVVLIEDRKCERQRRVMSDEFDGP
jgi:hypothetical protein